MIEPSSDGAFDGPYDRLGDSDDRGKRLPGNVDGMVDGISLSLVVVDSSDSWGLGAMVRVSVGLSLLL